MRTHTIYLQAALLARAPVCANGPGRANPPPPPQPPPPPFKNPPLSFPHTGSSFLWQAATTPRVVLSQSSVAIAHADQDGAELGALVAAAWVVPSRKHNSKNLRPGRRTELPCPRPALRNWGMIMASVTNGSRVWSCCTVRPVRIHRPQCSLPESRVAIVLFSKKKNPRFLVPLTPSPVSPSLPFLVATGSGSNRANPTGMVQIVQPPWELETNRRSSMPGQGGWVAARGRGPGKTIGAPGVGSSPCPTGLGFTLQT